MLVNSYLNICLMYILGIRFLEVELWGQFLNHFINLLKYLRLFLKASNKDYVLAWKGAN